MKGGLEIDLTNRDHLVLEGDGLWLWFELQRGLAPRSFPGGGGVGASAGKILIHLIPERGSLAERRKMIDTFRDCFFVFEGTKSRCILPSGDLDWDLQYYDEPWMLTNGVHKIVLRHKNRSEQHVG